MMVMWKVQGGVEARFCSIFGAPKSDCKPAATIFSSFCLLLCVSWFRDEGLTAQRVTAANLGVSSFLSTVAAVHVYTAVGRLCVAE